MNLCIFPSRDAANAAAVDGLAGWLAAPGVRNVMVAGGNTPLDLYAGIARLGLNLAHLNVFMLDEYVGVPADEPRNCANLLLRTVVAAWHIPPDQFFAVSSRREDALASAIAQERRLAAGGLDVIILGLGPNGHLGFNEPGSRRDSTARVVDLVPSSVEANRRWFGGDYAPAQGATVGLTTILAARHVLLLGLGAHKQTAVKAMIEGPETAACPASFLQSHPNTFLFLDDAAAGTLDRETRRTRGGGQ